MAIESLQSVLRPILLKMKAEGLGIPAEPEASRGDSYLEERFWSLIDETQGGREGSLDQFEIGEYRVDSIFLVPQGAVVVELDGAAFHRDQRADYRRDTVLLRSVYGVIRIRYYDLMTFPRSALYTIGRFYPRFLKQGLQTFESHDDPRTANLLGISWRQSGHVDERIIRRIYSGERSQ